MGKLAEYLRSEADTIRARKAKRREELEGWKAALNDLFGQLDGWLAETDPDGLLDRSADPVTINDPSLGVYAAPARQIRLGDQVIEIVPRARRVAAAVRLETQPRPFRPEGLVEMRDLGTPFRSLYRHPEGGWYIQNQRPSDEFARPLDRDRFEDALSERLR